MSDLMPTNIEAEEAILGGILIDPEAISRIAELLRPEFFAITAHQVIYRSALGLFLQGQPTDLMTVTTWLTDRNQLEQVGGLTKLAQLVDRTVSAVNIDQYAALVEDKYQRRRLIEAGNNIVQLGYETAAPLETVLDRAEQEVFGITQDRPQQDLVSIGETLNQTFQDLENRNEGLTLPGIPCGFYDLDAMTGGFQRSDLIIVAARPAMGKTAFCTNIAHHIAAGQQKLPVAVFSLEMSKEQLVQRILSSEAKIESNRLRSGRISQNEWEPISTAIGNLSELPLFIDDTPNITVMEIRSKVRRLQAEQGGALGLILLDYLQLMEGSSDNRVQELSRITRSLKGLARELNVPIIALSQLSRSVEARTNKRPMMSDLRESGCLTGDSLVTLADSGLEVPIRDLVGKSGFAVWGLNSDTLKQEKAIVTNAFCTGVKPVWEMTTCLGNSITATGNHKFFTSDGWKRLDELKIGDRIATPRSIPCTEVQTMGNAELALLGHLIGDGCTLPRHTIQYTTRELDLAELVAHLAREVFGDQINPRIKRERDWYQVYLPASYRLAPNIKNQITKWLEQLEIFGLRSHEKFIPSLVFTQPQESIALFLRHLWATDGCIRTSKDNSHYPSVYYGSSSERLARGVRSLLLKLNINASLKSVSQGNKGRTQYQVWVGGKQCLEKFVYGIGAVGNYKQESLFALKIYLENSGRANTNRDLIPNQVWRTQVNIARERLGLTTKQIKAGLGVRYCGDSSYQCDISRERAMQLANLLESEEILKIAASDIYWDKIKKIDFIGEEMVYDLTVDKVKNFATQGLYAHNSIEQDADLVIMLYRDEYYNPDSPDRGIAEVIITKHRNGPTGIIKLLFDAQFTSFRNLASPKRS
ncbi:MULTISPECIES: replicative DNA helicase [Microcoleaceae]|uniref:replicative DNA helicase n=1 Tax=Microcoleaceae TaxID=1892252 RepID=UPI0018803605|nr:replicative DNA helicase [Tychonema sp. LEGE 06208]